MVLIGILIFIIVITLVTIILCALLPDYRPLIAGIYMVYTSLPLYLLIASLPIDYRLRIALQLVAFSLMLFLVLYMVLSHHRRLTLRTREIP
ncbi:MAG: hypothetical protein QW775_05965 [Ignisphaera sp.]|uniref:Uncharacterized protein n=1 Tax=Ignisphaera aggregans TaxID=334771 RepID=A0A7C4NK31_9CREN